MSNYTRFYPELLTGHLKYVVGNSTQRDLSFYVACDGSEQNVSEYNNLYNYINQKGGYGSVFNLWEKQLRLNTSNQNALIYANNIFLSVGAGFSGNPVNIYYSNDAVTWSTTTAGTSSIVRALTYGNNLYVYAGDGGVLATSANGITWTARTSGTTSTIHALTYGGGLYLYGGRDPTNSSRSRIGRSSDGISWQTVTIFSTTAIYALTYGNGIYVAGGTGGRIATSANAVTWTNQTSGTTSVIYALIYNENDNVFVYGGAGGVLATSTNGTTWSTKTSNTTASILSLAYSNGIYVYGDGDGNVGTSTDLNNWKNYLQTSTTYDINAIASDGQKFVFVTLADGGSDTYVGIGNISGNTKFTLPNKTTDLVSDVFTQKIYIKK